MPEAAEKARLLTEPHDGHEPEVTCPGCPHQDVETAQLTDDEQRLIWEAGEHHPDHCDCAVDWEDRDLCYAAQQTLAAVDRVLLARAFPPGGQP